MPRSLADRHLRENGNRGVDGDGRLEKQRAVDLLNRIREAELAGVVRYTHYSFLVFGLNRIPIVYRLREQAAESLTRAQQAGEMITLLREYPSLAVGRCSIRTAPTLVRSCASRWKPRQGAGALP